MATLTIQTARVFQPLLEPSRYKGAWGGRGSGKSHFFGELLIERAMMQRGLHSVCIREVQKTLAQSSRRLIETKLQALGLGEKDGFKVFKECVETPGDGLIIFQGMQNHTAESIKSLEGYDIACIDEAQTISKLSLQLLQPTIRKENSEIWASWNARRKNDPIDKLLRGPDLPTDAIVVEANWRDNPWFTNALEQERKDCQRLNPDEYDHIWDGGYQKIVKGAYFAAIIKKAERDGRISRVGPDPLMTYRWFVDIGGTGAKSDNFVIWVAQFIGREIRVVDHYEVQGQDIAFHLAEMRSRGYNETNSNIWLPHDGGTNDRVHNVSYESAFESAGFKVTVVPNQGKGAAMARVEEVRKLFSIMWIDKAKCSAGLDALGWYHEKWDDERDIGLGPEHDWASHSADAFGLMCVAYAPPTKPMKPINFVPEFADAAW